MHVPPRQVTVHYVFMCAFALQATTKELGRDLAEFFQLFARCASVVRTAEANTCIENISNNLLPVVSQEKCKVRISKFVVLLLFFFVVVFL